MTKKIPSSRLARTIADLTPGKTAFIVPWAMWVDSDKNCHINEAYGFNAMKSGTQELKITRTKDGYIVYIYDIDYKWNPSASNDPPYSGTEYDMCFGKVVAFATTGDIGKLTDEELVELQKMYVQIQDYTLAAKVRDAIKKNITEK